MASKRCLCSTIIQAARAVHGSYFQKHFHWSILVVPALVRIRGIVVFAIPKTTPRLRTRYGLQVCICRLDHTVIGLESNDCTGNPQALVSNTYDSGHVRNTPSHALWKLLMEQWHGQCRKSPCSLVPLPHEVLTWHYLDSTSTSINFPGSYTGLSG